MHSTLSAVSWWFGEWVTPDLIPNSAVKPLSGDDTRKGKVAHRQDTALKTKNLSAKSRGFLV